MPPHLNRFGLAVLAILSAAAVNPASAETLRGALAKAYEHNPGLNSARAEVRVTDEGVPLAKSGYRPRIAFSASVAYRNASAQVTTGSFGIQINQMLFDGFETRNNVGAAEAQVRAAEETLRNVEQNTLFNAASAYMDVIRDRQIASLRAASLDFLREQVRAASSRLQVGEENRTDVAQAEASRSAAIAQLGAARAQAAASAAVYLQVIGVRPDDLSAALPAVDLLPPDFGSATAIAVAEHPAIRATRHLIDAAGFSVKAAEGSLLPNVTASAGLSRDYSNDPAAARPWSNSATIGLTLTVPLYQGGAASAQVRQRKEELGKARIQMDVIRDQVTAALTSAWTQFVASGETVAADRELVSAARLALNGVIEERKAGQRTTLDVLNAQADVLSAQIGLASAEHDLVVASYAILSAMGRLSAQRLHLDVALYRSAEHYEAVKDKWFGLRTVDGR